MKPVRSVLISVKCNPFLWNTNWPCPVCMTRRHVQWSPDTNGLDDAFFNFMEPSWSSLDLTNICPPTIPTMFNENTATILTFIGHCLKPENADLLLRDDYKEFLELAIN